MSNDNQSEQTQKFKPDDFVSDLHKVRFILFWTKSVLTSSKERRVSLKKTINCYFPSCGWTIQ